MAVSLFLAVQDARLLVAAIFPSHLRPHVVRQETHALIIGRIQPEHTVENARGLLEPIQTPEAQPESMHATQKWPVVDPTPRQHSIEAIAERHFADAKAHLVMANRYLGPRIESEVA
jgi:hypothetical protein